MVPMITFFFLNFFAPLSQLPGAKGEDPFPETLVNRWLGKLPIKIPTKGGRYAREIVQSKISLSSRRGGGFSPFTLF
jgi:hypothetical protein